MYNIVLGENNAADQTKAMQDQMSGAALAVPDDVSKAFKVFFNKVLIVFYYLKVNLVIFFF
jgi:hypothetical protein